MCYVCLCSVSCAKGKVSSAGDGTTGDGLGAQDGAQMGVAEVEDMAKSAAVTGGRLNHGGPQPKKKGSCESMTLTIRNSQPLVGLLVSILMCRLWETMRM